MKFKVGDKVAVYDMGKRYVCTIKIINDSQTVTADYENNKPFTCLVHVKQCRLLVKKKRQKIAVMDLQNYTGSKECPVVTLTSVPWEAPKYQQDKSVWRYFVEVKEK